MLGIMTDAACDSDLASKACIEVHDLRQEMTDGFEVCMHTADRTPPQGQPMCVHIAHGHGSWAHVCRHCPWAWFMGMGVITMGMGGSVWERERERMAITLDVARGGRAAY